MKRIAFLAAVATASLLFTRRDPLKLKRYVHLANEPWHSAPSIGVAIVDFLTFNNDAQRGSASRELVTYELHVPNGVDRRACQQLYRMMDFLHTRRRDYSYNISLVTAGNDWCAPPSSNSSPHSLWLVEVQDFWSLEPVLGFPDQAFCRDCFSRLIIVHGHDRLALETLLDAILDRDPRWTLQHDVWPIETELSSHFFAIRHEPLPLSEQRFLLGLADVQSSPLPCSEQKFAIWDFAGHGPGFAALLNIRTNAFRFALFHGRTAVIWQNLNYIDQDFCKGATWDCYFHGDLLNREHRCSSYVRETLTANPDLSRPAEDDRDQFWYFTAPNPRAPHADEYQLWVRDTFVDGQRILSHLMIKSPRRFLRAALEDRLANLNPYKAYFGLHVRHGDKSLEHALVPFHEYMRHVQDLSRTAASRNVYIATDNATLLQYGLTQYPNFHFFYQDMFRAGSVSGSAGWWDQAPPTELLLNLLVDLHVLRGADVFIGTQFSGITWLIQDVRMQANQFSNHGLETVDGQIFTKDQGCLLF